MKDFFYEVSRLKGQFSKVYIYGAGLYGQNVYKALKDKNIMIDGFVITKKTNETHLFQLPVYEAADVIDNKTGIIIAVNRHNLIDVKTFLQSINYNLNDVVLGTEFIENNSVRGGYDEIPAIEITTKIGCSVNCKYCPQKVLIKKYYHSNKERKSVMSLELFQECLKKLPLDCTVIFGGMAEPFLNRKCTEMLKMACDSGRRVDLYTTLVGSNSYDIKQICELPLDYIVLHLADKFGYAHIPVSKSYYDYVEILLNYKKKDGTPLVSICNAQAEVDDRLKEICDGKYYVLTTLLDRAGNLTGENLLKRKSLTGMLSCSLCGSKINHNVLLPDGTVLLCCMDYGMKHVLGNLMNSSYEKIMSGKEIESVRNGMLGDSSIEILCRNCSCANAKIC